MKKGVIAAIIFLVIVLAIAAFMMFNKSDSPESASQKGDSSVSSSSPRIINVKAARFDYTPDTIRVKQGERVRIVVENSDTMHGIAIPDLGLMGRDSLEFTATQPGTYEFECPTMCGSGHREMKGTLIVE